MRRETKLHTYVAGVTIAGVVVLFALGGRAAGQIRFAPVTFTVLTAFVLLGDLLSIRVRRSGGGEEDITTSATFSFAILLLLGTGAAVVAQAGASILGDLFRRNRPQRAVFNAGQLALSLAAAGTVLERIDPLGSGSVTLSWRSLLGLLAAGLIFFLVNSIVTGIAVALSTGAPIRKQLLEDAGFQGFIDAILIGLAPLVVVVARYELALVPLFALPMLAVGQSARRAIQNHLLAEELSAQAAEKDYMALHDALTGLPNRTLFQDRIEQALREARRDMSNVALLIMDLNRFKDINDTLGHHNGDRALCELAGRLEGTLRDSDTVARLGGDEFGILLPGVQGTEGARMAAERILDVFGEPFAVSDLTLEMDASLGIAVYPQDGLDSETLMQRADVAMYTAKESRQRYSVYVPDLDRYNPERLLLVGELRTGLEAGQLFPVFQPKLDLRRGVVTGVEALVRWNHPRHGVLPPSEFIPLAEYTGLIRPLTTEVVSESLRRLAGLRSQGFELNVAVNLSTHSLLDPKLPDEIRMLLQRVGGDPSWLELEITESSIMFDPTHSMRTLHRLADLGVGLAIDDFGTGYSSLAYLKQLPVTTLKIDRSFVMSMDTSASDTTIVRSIIDLGGNLGLEVVAEGVETPQALETLTEMGCALAQGYHIARPMPGEQVRDWLLGRREPVAI